MCGYGSFYVRVPGHGIVNGPKGHHHSGCLYHMGRWSNLIQTIFHSIWLIH